MAYQQLRQHRDYQQQESPRAMDSIKDLFSSERGPSKSQVLTIVTLLPIGAVLLLLAGLTLTGTLIGLAVATPLFIIFSPVLVPAVLLIGFADTGFLTAGAFGITALSSFSWLMNYLREMRGGFVPEQVVDRAKRGMHETAGYLGQKTKDVGQTIENRAPEGGRT